MKSKLKESGISHISIIMDGNGRWAKAKGMPRVYGHEKGAEALRNIVDYAGNIGLDYLSVYAFSTENWSRPKKEVDALMSLLVKFCTKETPSLLRNNCKLSFVGDIENMPSKQKKAIHEATETLKDCDGLHLIIFMNYGGRADIINACKKLIDYGIKSDDITPELFAKNLYTGDIPDPDLVIRTSGELRLSNYILWQLSYSELYFTDAYWPDFDFNDLDAAIEEYTKRNRRFGGV